MARVRVLAAGAARQGGCAVTEFALAFAIAFVPAFLGSFVTLALLAWRDKVRRDKS